MILRALLVICVVIGLSMMVSESTWDAYGVYVMITLGVLLAALLLNEVKVRRFCTCKRQHCNVCNRE